MYKQKLRVGQHWTRSGIQSWNWTLILLLALYTIAFLWVFQFTPIDSKNNIDGSWHYTLSGLRHSGQHLGTNIYFNYGPLFEKAAVFVHPRDHIKDMVIGDAYIFVILALLLFTLTRFYRYWHAELSNATLITVSVAVFLSLYQIDTLFCITALIGALTIWRQTKPWAQLLILAGLELFALYKFSFSLLLLVLSPFMVFHGFSRPLLKRSLLNWVVFCASFWLVYCAATWSFNPIYFIRYLHYGIVNSLFYNEYMSLPLSTNLSVLVVFLAITLLGAVGVLRYLLKQRAMFTRETFPMQSARLVPLIIILLSSYVLFKEAVTRTDEHVILFVPMLFIWSALAIGQLRPTQQKAAKHKRPTNWWAPAAIGSVVLLYFWVVFTAQGTGPVHTLSKNFKNYGVSLWGNRLNYSYFQQVRQTSVRSFAARRHELDPILAQKALPPHATVIYWGNTTLLSDILISEGYHVLQEPFLQNYAAHPPTLFDPLYINYARSHPHAYIFEEETEGSVNEHIPTYQLNDYFEYVTHNYRTVGRDDNQRQYILAPQSQQLEACYDYATETAHIGTIIAPNLAPIKPGEYIKARITTSGTLPESVFGLLVKQPVYDYKIYNQNNGMMRWRIAKTTLEHGVALAPLYLNYHDAVNNVPFQLHHFAIHGALNRYGHLHITYAVCGFSKTT